MKFLKITAITVFFAVLFGCATSSAVIVGEKRPAISPEEVKLYIDPPSQFETIAILQSSSDVNFSNQAAQDRAIAKLKKEAAKIGANGLLITGIGQGSGGAPFSLGAGQFNPNSFVTLGLGQTQSDTVSAQARAIYVTETEEQKE
jgi:hypothetical protein